MLSTNKNWIFDSNNTEKNFGEKKLKIGREYLLKSDLNLSPQVAGAVRQFANIILCCLNVA